MKEVRANIKKLRRWVLIFGAWAALLYFLVFAITNPSSGIGVMLVRIFAGVFLWSAILTLVDISST